MRTVWSILVVVVLLVPLGGVGITVTPIEAEVVASPRNLSGSLATLRARAERVPVAAALNVVESPPRSVHAPPAGTSSASVTDRHPPSGPRDPPV